MGGRWRRGRLIVAVAVVTGALAAVPAATSADAPELDVPEADAGTTELGDDCAFPSSWDELTSAGRLGCNARELATLAGWIGAALLVAYLVAAVALRPIPLASNSGPLGTLRRGRERLPLVGGAYRPRIELVVTDAAGANGPLARSIHELLIGEMTPASDEAWFRERLTGDGIGEGLGKTLEAARPGLGDLSSFLLSRLPRLQIGIRVQLHEPTATLISLTAEVLDRRRRAMASRTFWCRRTATGDDGITDHYLLVRPVAAWLAFQLYDVWPGEASARPNPMNTENAESFGAFRRGELFETVGRIDEARSAYHEAISADGNNVGALLNLALLDSRDRQRVEWCKVRLSDARVLVDDIRSTHERARLLVQIQHVQAVASMNEAMWRELEPEATVARRARLATSTAAVQDLARSIHRLTSLRSARGRYRDDREWGELTSLGVAHEHRAVALAACIAVEHERLGITVRPRSPTDVQAAIDLVARGGLLTFGDCHRVLDQPGQPISTAATYILACALGRDPQAQQESDGVPYNGPAMLFLREALAGDRDLGEWALPDDGDPAFAGLRDSAAWAALRAEFLPAVPEAVG